MIRKLFLGCFALLLFSCYTAKAETNSDFRLDRGYTDNGSMNGNHTIVFFSGKLSKPNEIRKPLLRGFEQAHIIADPDDNLIVLFINENREMTLFYSERYYYINFLNEIVSEEEFIQYVSSKYGIQ